MLNFVICDDNSNILDKVEKMLQSIFVKHTFDARVVFKSEDFDEILEYVDSNKTDVLILDINLKTTANLLLGDIQAYLNKTSKKITDTCLTQDKIKDLVKKLDEGVISHKNFKDLVIDIMETDKTIDDLLKEKGIQNVVDNSFVLDLIDKVLTENEKVVTDYLNGNERSFKFLMGQVMKESKGSVNPKVANDLLLDALTKMKNKL